MKILIIEDEPELRKAIRNFLAKEFSVIEEAADYVTGSDKLAMYDYDCIVLDIMLPDGDGLNLLDSIKQLGKTHNVIIISAKDSLDDKLKGLQLGADDYMTKPFHLAELNARIHAILRRNVFQGKEILEWGNVSLDVKERSVQIQGQTVNLYRKEWDILKYLLINKTRLVTKQALAEHVWGDNVDQADNLDFIYFQIKNLRKKLQLAKANIEIEAVYGVGYKLMLA